MRALFPFERWSSRLWAPVPASIRDDMARLQFTGLQSQIPLLYSTVIMVLATVMTMTPADAGFLIRFGLPGTIIVACVLRFLWWIRRVPETVEPDTGRHWIKVQSRLACLIAILCSVWTSVSWLASSPEDRTFYPMFMAIGLFSAAFCMSSIRRSAILLLVSGLLPMLVTLAVFGGSFDRTAVILVILAAVFLGRLVIERHNQLVTLLILQQQMGELAATDPLTGLPNRRRLFDRLQLALRQGNRPALLLLDLDGFKPINDQHGHAVGDELLCAIGQRLREAVDPGQLVCRLGGDEFAMLLDTADAARARRVADQLLATFIEPFVLTDLRLRIGASLGYVVAARGEADPHALIAAADTRLYAAKAHNRRSSDTARPIRPSGTRG